MKYYVRVKILLVFFILSQGLADCSENKLVSSYANEGIYEAVLRRLDYLVKDPSIQDYYTIDEHCFKLFASPEKKQENEYESIYYFQSKENHRYLIKPGLKGKKIAIDPGHLGGQWGFLEGKYLDMQGLSFFEGDLTLLTAYVLKERLEKAGATVFITRTEAQSVLKENFWSWLRNDLSLIDREISINPQLKKERTIFYKKSSLESLFRKYYNRLDLFKRAEIINQFDPDLTIIIHYNMGGRLNSKTGENIPEQKNMCLVFIPGAFQDNELKDEDSRLAFKRLALGSHLDQSIKLAQSFIRILENSFEEIEIPGPEYFTRNTCYVSSGVYCRNLLLNRKIKSPLIYGETFFQDNLKESKYLNDKSLVINNIKGPQRIIEVAEVYFKSISHYYDQM